MRILGGTMALFRFPWKRQESDDIATMEEAQLIFGKDRICNAKEVFDGRNASRHISPKLLFMKSMLERCAYQNKREWADWWLVYVIGQSLVQLHEDPVTRGFFFPQPIFWQEPYAKWLTVGTPSGYWLINFKPRFKNMSFDTQRKELGQYQIAYGPEYVDTPEHIVAEALINIWMTKVELLLKRKENQEERPLEHCFHCGPHNERLGHFNESGLLIHEGQ